MNQELLKGNVFKALVSFAIPFLLSNLLQVLYGAADLFMVGRFALTSDVSGVAIGSQIMTLFLQFVLGLTTGVTVLLGQYFGASKKREMSKTVGGAIVLFTSIGIIATIILVTFNHQIVSLMNTPKPAVNATRSYFLICSLGILFIIGYNVVSSILRGIGDSKTPLLFIFVACIINIGLDFYLISIVHLGAMGAAIATISAQGISFIFSLIYLKIKGMGFSFYKEDIKISKTIKKIIKVGIPLAIQSTLVGISFIIITIVINSMGVVASAAVGVDEKIIEFLMLPSIALSSAIATMSAQNIGAQQYQRAKQSMNYGIIICLVFAALAVTITHIDGTIITRLFASDKEVIDQAALYLQTYSLDCFCVSFIFCINGYLNGAGRTMFTMFHSLIATFIGRIPLTIFISSLSNITLWHMGLASPLSSLISIVLCIIYLKRIQNENNLS